MGSKLKKCLCERDFKVHVFKITYQVCEAYFEVFGYYVFR